MFLKYPELFQITVFVLDQTWTSRCLMKYYATVAASSSLLKSQDTVERIEKRVLDSNPIMEAFGETGNQFYFRISTFICFILFF